MDRQDCVRASIAAALGAIGGVSISVVLGFHPVWWTLNLLVAGFLGFVLYKPKEVITELKSGFLLRLLRKISWSPTSRQDGASRFSSTIRRIGRGFYTISKRFIVAVFIVVFTMWLPVLLALGTTLLLDFERFNWEAFFTFSLAWLILLVFAAWISEEALEKWDSEALFVISRWLPEVTLEAGVFAVLEEKIVWREDSKLFLWKRFLRLSFTVFCFPLCILLIALVLVIEALMAVFIALATTWRLAATFGAVTGSVSGACVYAFAGFSIPLSFVVGVLIAALIPPVCMGLRTLSTYLYIHLDPI